MNFLPGTLSADAIDTPLGRLVLDDHDAIAAEAKKEGSNGEVLIGIRPEQIEDASLIDPAVKARGTTFTADIDVLESMGSDKYAYFTIDSGRAANDALAELAADSGSDLGTGEMVARLSPESAVTKNSRAELVFDTDKIAVFDQQSGVSLRRR